MLEPLACITTQIHFLLTIFYTNIAPNGTLDYTI